MSAIPQRFLLAAGALLAWASLTTAGTIRHDRIDADYLGYATMFPSVGRVGGTFAGGGGLTGSGVLIAPDLVLTAAHVAEGTDSLTYRIPELGVTYDATAVVTHPGWTGDVLTGYDLSVFRLNRPVTEVAPVDLFPGWWDARRPGAMAGYGISGTGLTGFTGGVSAVRRAGVNLIDRRMSGRILLSDFDAPHSRATGAFLGSSTPQDLEYTIAPGDSGGGLFIWANRRWQLVGINSFILSYDGDPDATYGDSAGFTRVRVFRNWILDVMTGDIQMDGFGSGASFASSENAAAYAVVPEPGSVGVVLVGVTGLLGVRRWR